MRTAYRWRLGCYLSTLAPFLALALVQLDLAASTAGVGSAVAGTAAELRWERLVGLVALLWLTTLDHCFFRQLQPLFSCVFFLLLALSDVGGKELSSGLALAQAPLWGSPLHVGVAVVCAQLTILSVHTSNNRRWAYFGGLGSVCLLALGLVWNNTQARAQLSWAWDWIEIAPLCLLLASLGPSHTWNRGSWLWPAGLYLALLQLSRSALLASAHHLQPPRGVGSFDEAGLVSTSEALGLSAVAGLLPTTASCFLCTWILVCLPKDVRRVVWCERGPTCAPGRLALAPKPWAYHVGILSTAMLALVPTWTSSVSSLNLVGSTCPLTLVWYVGLFWRGTLAYPNRTRALKC